MCFSPPDLYCCPGHVSQRPCQSPSVPVSSCQSQCWCPLSICQFLNRVIICWVESSSSLTPTHTYSGSFHNPISLCVLHILSLHLSISDSLFLSASVYYLFCGSFWSVSIAVVLPCSLFPENHFQWITSFLFSVSLTFLWEACFSDECLFANPKLTFANSLRPL
jgi:hypothetical protein